MSYEKIFQGNGEVFSASCEAKEWLSKNGYSYGSSCVSGPIGVIKGDAFISKWHNMTKKEQSQMDGLLYTDREGPARLVLKSESVKPKGAIA